MKVEELEPMTPEAFGQILASKGWSADYLAVRWGMTKRRVQQIKADSDRPRYYDDAVRGLPNLRK